MVIKRRRKSRKPRAKSVKLDKTKWVSGVGIKDFREKELRKQKGVCEISKVPLTNDNSVLDHCHSKGIGSEGKCRGVLLSEVNCLEGKYLKAFKKMKLGSKYNLEFSEFLIGMGEYLQRDNSNKPYHYAYMTDKRKSVTRLTKKGLLSKLLKDFNIEVDTKEPHSELVRLYMQHWVYQIESNK